MKVTSVFIAFFSISSFQCLAESIPNCVRSSAGECLAYDVGMEDLSLCDANDCRLYATLGNHYFAPELCHYQLEGVIPAHTISFATGMDWFGYSLYNQFRIKYAMAKRLGNHCSLGVGMHLSSLYYEGVEQRHFFLSENLVFLYQGRRTDLYARGDDLFDTGWKGILGERMRSPAQLTAGAKFHFSENVSCATEIVWREGNDWLGRFGFLYDMGKFQLRCGALGPPITPTFGCGFVGKRFRLDASTRWVRNIGYAIDCGIGYLFHENDGHDVPHND